ncbi:MAG: homoserine O-acetyltransferase MetA [Christensenellales bacterium]|jgi:homoserine O-succinyltransferase
MPVRIPDTLPAAEVLAGENIFVMRQSRALRQDIRPLRIGILNLMPTKEVTETQLLRLIGNTALQVDVTLLTTASYRPTHTDAGHLESFYQTFQQVREEKFDGLIITGAPVEQLDFHDVLYWRELERVMAWADQHVYSTLYICWASQAGLYYHYGIDKNPLPRKMFGVFEHRVLDRTHPLVRGFDDTFFAPHSRHTGVSLEQVAACADLTVLATSPEAGLYLAATRDGRHVYVSGHCEYDVDTLDKEYRRDVAKGLPIQVPCNYYPDDDPARQPEVKWRGHANLLFANWLNYCVYQQTPYRLEEIG